MQGTSMAATAEVIDAIYETFQVKPLKVSFKSTPLMLPSPFLLLLLRLASLLLLPSAPSALSAPSPSVSFRASPSYASA